ncbi:uncharacterized protein A1O9_07994 [Exophiala aquamarina CBS 119918]|uniref:Oxidoreductase n=1 Tax=Exophiala aquamarina CBS 119918 TaxID=1182545 RepID=A0A072PAW6_9EURO|nr:uncharacterized protein A1O9_07994 [Exophiala aquamarina CBS 119918]KEF56413.1 hypothetical protein A1O9_07994 [Exophiala aquamarina CBS 119918]
MAPSWLITGSSSGFGLALVRYLLAQGHSVIATSRNPSKTPDLIEEVASKPNGAWLALDVVASKADIDKVIYEAWAKFDGIDFLVNNAGYSILGAAEEIPEHQAKDQFEVNFWGAVRATQSILPLMRSRRSGTIINISSVAGGDPLPTCAIYAASKVALEAWTESLSHEVRHLGIRGIVIQPGAFRTNFFSSSAMQIVTPSQAYAGESSPVAQTLGKFGSIDASNFSDPIKAAERIVEVGTETGFGEGLKVLRVPLGPDCYRRVFENHGKREADLEATKSIATSTS